MKIKKLLLTVFILTLAADAFSQSFRINKAKFVNITKDVDFSSSVKMNINDALVIFIPEERPYMNGIELKITIPEEIAITRNSCQLELYDSVKPAPSSDQIDYSGIKIFQCVMPSKFTWIVQIPFTADTKKLKTNQYTTKIDSIPNLKNNYLFIRMNQLLPKTDESLVNAEFTITVSPFFSNNGSLSLNILADGQKTDRCSVLIDDLPCSIENCMNGITLSSGLHTVAVISEKYRTEVRTVRIEQARLTNLTIILKSIEPTLIISAPNNVSVFIDGSQCNSTGKEFFITEGEHNLKFKIGNYELIRTVNAMKGKTYKIDVTFDVQIIEQ